MFSSRSIKLLCLFSIMPLVLGLLAYLIFGSIETKIVRFFNDLMRNVLLDHMRPDFMLPTFVRNHLSDGLWAFSLTSTLIIVMNQMINKWILLVISFLSIMLYEVVQLYGFINGIADIVDVCVMLVFSVSAFYLVNKTILS